MQVIDPSYRVIRDEAYRLAASYKQRVGTPHLVLAIIHTKNWPHVVPEGAEDFCWAVIKALPPETNTTHGTTLYAQMVLEQSDDATSLVFYLFWSSWEQEDHFIQTWKQLNWAPAVKLPNDRSKPSQQAVIRDKETEASALERQRRSQVSAQQCREWPRQVIEILRGIDTETIRFVCIYAINYVSFSVIGGIEWGDEGTMLQPGIMQIEIESMTGGTPRVWRPKVSEFMADARTQWRRTDYRFMGDTSFTLCESDNLWVITPEGERLQLLPIQD